MTDYFNNLDENLKKFCEEKDFYPTNDKEFNDFVRSYCELDNLKDFFVELKEPVEIENEPTTLVPILCNQPFYAFIPNVWNAMTEVQRVQAIAMTYNFICNEMSPRLKKKPQLIFVDSTAPQGWVGYCTYDDKNQMYISLSSILSSDDSICSKFLVVIKHELTHAEQDWEREKNWKYVKSQNYDFSKLSDYQKKLFFKYSGGFGYNANILRINTKFQISKTATKYLSKEEITLWLKLEAEDNYDWYFLKNLLYACSPCELSAENNAHKFLEKISKICPSISNVETNLDCCLSALKQSNFDISYKDVENFMQMDCIAQITYNADEVLCKEIAYLLNIYRTKKVEKPFMENYDKFENDYFKETQERWMSRISVEE